MTTQEALGDKLVWGWTRDRTRQWFGVEENQGEGFKMDEITEEDWVQIEDYVAGFMETLMGHAEDPLELALHEVVPHLYIDLEKEV